MKQDPSRIAIYSKTGNLTYRELHQLLCQMCGFLANNPTNNIAFPAEPSLHAVSLLFACFRMQRCAFPFHPKLSEETKKTFFALTIDPSRVSLGSFLEITEMNLKAFATAIATSGTAGKPKLTLHTIHNHFISAQTTIAALNLLEKDIYLLNLPIYHVSGIAICWRTFVAGASLALPGATTNVSHLSMVPTQLYRMLESKMTYPKLKCLLVGGAALPLSLYERALKAKLPLYLSYGMTETSSLISVKKPSALPLSAGEVLAHAEITITEDQEIQVRGPALFYGYLGQQPLDQKNWFPTKDLGRWNSFGQLEILGRKDRQFISGGENIQPEEIEQALLSHPQIFEAQIESIEDKEFGFRPKAHIFCTKSLTEKEIRVYLEKLLLPFKIPTTFTFYPTFLKKGKLLQ